MPCQGKKKLAEFVLDINQVSDRNMRRLKKKAAAKGKQLGRVTNKKYASTPHLSGAQYGGKKDVK